MNGRMEAEQMAAEHEAKQPVAWAVMDGTKTVVGHQSCDRDKAEAWAREYGFPEVVALYRQPQPTLTDAEREALRGVLNDPDLVLGDCRKPLEDLLARSATSTR